MSYQSAWKKDLFGGINVFDFEHIGDKSLQGLAGRRKMRDSTGKIVSGRGRSAVRLELKTLA